MLSHSHPDHWLELPVLRNALKYVLSCHGLDVYATAETLELAEQLTGSRLAPTFRPHVIADGAEFTIGDQRWRCSRTDHPVETLGLSVDADGRSLGYTADTGPGVVAGRARAASTSDSARRRSCTTRPNAIPVHLSASRPVRWPGRPGSRHLVITHVLPTGSPSDVRAEASDAYGAPVDVATLHRTFDV